MKIRVSKPIYFFFLALALSFSTRAWATNVVVFDDGNYVDTVAPPDSESDNIQASASSFGHSVTTITGITAADFTSGLAGQQVLLIPDLEIADLAPDLVTEVQDLIRNFVSSGGRLVITNSDDNSNAGNFLNTVFGFSLTSDTSNTEVTSDISAAAGQTLFAGQIATLPANDATMGLGNLPTGGISVYDTAFNSSMVLIIPSGQGEIIYLGYDWFNSDPPTAGQQDGGWQAVLAAALADADLAITKSASSSAVSVGDQITFTLTVTNNGPNDAAFATITDNLPAGVTLISTTPSQGTCSGTTPITCDLGALANGASATIQVVVTADAAGSIDNQASVTGPMIDTNTVNNQADAMVNVSGDTDGDGVLDTVDNCPSNANTNQSDLDGDGIGDVCDPTPSVADISGGGCSLNNQAPATSTSTLLFLGGLAFLAWRKKFQN
jgi:uncharacterized repeat protein (TIGR01451 family)